MASKGYGAIALAGGGIGALDKIDGAILNDGDVAIVVDAINNNFNSYTLVVDSDATEAVPFIIKPDTNAGEKRWILASSPPKNEFYVDSSLADQGAATTEGGRSLKDFVDLIGSTKNATIMFSHYETGNTTTYTLTTSETVTSNINLKIDNGAIIDGAGTLTIYSPEHIIASGRQQIATATFNLLFTKGGRVYPGWFGAKGDNSNDDTNAISAVIDSLNTSGGILYFPIGIYKITGVLSTITQGLNVVGENRRETKVITNSGTADVFVITCDEACSFERLTIDSSVTRTAGSYIKVSGGGTNANAYSYFGHCRLANHYWGIRFSEAYGWKVDDCYFVDTVYQDLSILNAVNADQGDSNITNSVFDTSDNTGTWAILQGESGGLKMTGNKILNHELGYVGDFTGVTSNLLMSNNSFEGQATVSIYLNETGGTFRNIIIDGNQFNVTGDRGIDILDVKQIVITNNTLNLASGTQQAIRFQSGEKFFIGGNIIQGNGGTPTGIYITDGVTEGRIAINKYMALTTNINNLATSATVQIDKKQISNTGTWDIPNTNDGSVQQTNITATGAAVGDSVIAGHTILVGTAWLLTGEVSAANTVTITALNKTGGADDPASGTLSVTVFTNQ